MNKKFLIAALAVTVIGGGLFTVSSVSAQGLMGGDDMTSIVQKIADKFKLNKADVQSVFDEVKNDRMAKMEANFTAKLDQLVKDGKITAAQKDLIAAKHKELEANRKTEAATKKNMTMEQRKAEMDKQRQDLENWAKQNNIDIKYLMGFGPRKIGFKK